MPASKPAKFEKTQGFVCIFGFREASLYQKYAQNLLVFSNLGGFEAGIVSLNPLKPKKPQKPKVSCVFSVLGRPHYIKNTHETFGFLIFRWF